MNSTGEGSARVDPFQTRHPGNKASCTCRRLSSPCNLLDSFSQTHTHPTAAHKEPRQHSTHVHKLPSIIQVSHRYHLSIIQISTEYRRLYTRWDSCALLPPLSLLDHAFMIPLAHSTSTIPRSAHPPLISAAGAEAREFSASANSRPAGPPGAMGVSEPKHFVLVHGGGLGAWCWYKVIDLLRKKGHKATAIDLISSGKDQTDPNAVTSFVEYNQPLVDFFETLSGNEKVVLVGHDLGGLSVTYAMEHFHQNISASVFLAAMMLPSGFPLTLELFEMDPEVGAYIEYTFGDGVHAMPTSLYVLEKMQPQVFYNMSPSEDIVLASLLSKPVPLRMLNGSCIDYTEEKYGTIPKVYIKTMQDKIFAADSQEEAFLSDPECVPSETRELDSDHSPFFSKPVELVEELEDIACAYA